MNTLPLLLLIVPLCVALQITLELPLNLSDPARCNLQLFTNNTYINTFHPQHNKFILEITPETNYTFLLQSIDLSQPASFSLYSNNTIITLIKLSSTIHPSLTNALPQITTTNTTITLPHLYPPYFLHESSQMGELIQMLSTVPGLGYIIQSKLMLSLVALIITIMVAPVLLTKLDPAFADRVVEAQLKQKEGEKLESNE